MKRSVQIACAFLFLGTTVCSLVLSASSTLAKAEAVHVPAGAVWSAVGVLELVSLAGTVRWLVATTDSGRLHAVAVVAAVALVTGVAGWAAYGWFGVVAPIAIVVTIHMVHETLRDLEPMPTTSVDPSEQHRQSVVDEPAPALVEVVDEPVEPADREPTLVDRVRELREKDPRVSERTLRDELGVSRHQIRCALIELRTGLSEVAS